MNEDEHPNLLTRKRHDLPLAFVLLVSTISLGACMCGDPFAEACDEETYQPECVNDHSYTYCESTLSGIRLLFPHVEELDCHPGSVCHQEGGHIGCIAPERERCDESELGEYRCVNDRKQSCQQLTLGADIYYWDTSPGTPCDFAIPIE